jgi:peptide/nickel transport system substrate-binding protein
MRTRSKRLTSLVAVAAAALLALTACGGGSSGNTSSSGSSAGFTDCDKSPNTCNSGKTKAGGEYIFGLEQTFTSWNIYTSEGNTLVLGQTMEGILPQVYRADPSGKLQLNTDLLVSAEVTNQSPQTIVYKLKPNAVWSDGVAISADDFTLAWKQNTGNPADCTKCDSASTSGYELIKSIVGSDNGKTVTVTFQDGKVYSDWKGLFATDGLYPAHLATKQGFDLSKPDGVNSAADWFSTTVPTWSGGPFIIDSYTKDQSVVEKKNDKWYGATKSTLDKLIYKFVIDQASVAPAATNHELTGMQPQPNADLVNQIKAIPGVISHLDSGYSWEHLDLNLKNKYLADVALRQAIFTAINVKTIIGKTYGVFDSDAKPLGSHNFFPGDPHYKDVVTSTGQGSGDADKAKKILTDAGYTIANGKLMAKDGTAVPTLRYRYTKGNQLRETTGELVQSELKAIGVDVQLQDTETLGKTLQTGDFDIMIFAWVGSALFQGAAEQNWETGNGGNYGGYSNPDVDKLVKEGAQSFDVDKAADLLNQADTIMSKEAYVLPLTQKPAFFFTYSDFVNIRNNTSQWGPQYNVQEWGQKAS